MKKIFFPAMAAMALGLASCSSDSVTQGNGGQPSFAEGGYAKVAIDLPTQSSTNRAVTDGDQGQFDDGLASEYQVKNAKLVLFQGNSEADAKFHSAYDLNVSMDGYADTPNQITSTTRIVKKLNDGETLNGDQLYALVVLNDNGLLTISADGATLSVNGTDMANKGLSDLQQLVVDDATSNFTGNGILMTNAPLATKPGATAQPNGSVQTLVNFTNAVYETEAEAQSKPATDVYVERAVAKVTFTKTNATTFAGSNDVHWADETTPSSIAWSVEGWDLDVTNKSSYFVRNTTNADAQSTWNALKSENVSNYRFVGSNKVKDGVELYRTYWAEDPNYSSFVDGAFNLIPENETNFTTADGDANPQYCFENTFNVNNMNKNQTTRVVVKVKVGDGTTFYTFNNDKSRLYTADSRDARVKRAVLAMPEVESWVRAHGGYEEGVDQSNIAFNFGTKDANTGKVVLENNITVTTKTGEQETFDVSNFAGATNLNDALGLGDVVEYTGGYAYYPIRIKHFGSDLTPWNTEVNAPTTNIPTAANIYPGADNTNNYLGRYGVLRNNWYDLRVSSISGLGDAVVPSIDGTADDDLYNYIAVRINILSWAKRQQNADL